MLLITKFRLLFQITAKCILYGVLNVMLIAEYDDTDFIEGITVFYDRFPYVLLAIHVFHLLCIKHAQSGQKVTYEFKLVSF